jgi:hypothetical protein
MLFLPEYDDFIKTSFATEPNNEGDPAMTFTRLFCPFSSHPASTAPA